MFIILDLIPNYFSELLSLYTYIRLLLDIDTDKNTDTGTDLNIER